MRNRAQIRVLLVAAAACQRARDITVPQCRRCQAPWPTVEGLCMECANRLVVEMMNQRRMQDGRPHD